jgi:transposase
MSREKATWAEVRRGYESGEGSVAAIAARFGISAGSIYRRVRREGWARRAKRTRKKQNEGGEREAGRTGTPKSSRRTRAKGATRRAASVELIERLYNAMDAKLKRLEARIAMHEDISAAESERETRELGSMIRSFEKVTAFEAAIEGRDRKGQRKPVIAPCDAERMREEIAQRLERICSERQASAEFGALE